VWYCTRERHVKVRNFQTFRETRINYTREYFNFVSWSKVHFSSKVSNVGLRGQIESNRSYYGTDPSLHPPSCILMCPAQFCSVYIWKYRHKIWPLLVTPRSTIDPCMLHSPVSQIISRPVSSVNAVGLPSDCTPKNTNPILTDCCTIRRVCVCLNGSDVSPWLFWGFGCQELRFTLTYSTLPIERNVELCWELQTLKDSMVISVVTPSVGVWYSGTAVRPAA